MKELVSVVLMLAVVVIKITTLWFAVNALIIAVMQTQTVALVWVIMFLSFGSFLSQMCCDAIKCLNTPKA